MVKLVNRAKMTTATTGTGSITLGSAVDGYQTYADAGVVDGDVVRYVIEDGNGWEIGTGTYTASGTTLARTVSESSNAGAPINLSGSAVVFVGATAEDFFEYPAPATWVRNPAWPACEADAGDNKAVGLYAVWPGDSIGTGGNFFGLYAIGAYTIDFGDGTTTDFNSGSYAYYQYDYNNANLDGTDAPVTFTASTDTVNRTAHGYSNGATVRFYNIATTTGLDQGQKYYVVNATADTFQVSQTEGGTAITLTNDGSAVLLPYKVAVVTITPQAGQNLTTLNFFVKHNQSGLVNGGATGWLDIAIAAPSCTSLLIGSTNTAIRHAELERVRINELGAITSFNFFFFGMASLRVVEIADTITSVTSAIGMFNGCSLLRSVSLFDTSSVTNMTQMFNNCVSITTVPQFDTGSVTNMASMFFGCNSLPTIPLFNTSSVTNMSLMFYDCYSLVKLPPLDTSSVTNMQQMFNTCFSLKSAPLFDTSSVTTMKQLFNGCYAISDVPLFDTSSVTDMSYMFFNCYSLPTIPLFNTSSVTNMIAIFSGCRALQSVPLIDTSSITSMNNMFYNCYSLSTVPPFDTSSVTDMTGAFRNCFALQSVPLFDTSSVTTMYQTFGYCFALSSIPLFDTSSVTNMYQTFVYCYALKSVPALDVSSVTNFSSTFNVCYSLSRIEATEFRFSFAPGASLSADALNEIYTNLPTVTGQTITVTGNYGTSEDDPTIATAKGWTVIGS